MEMWNTSNVFPKNIVNTGLGDLMVECNASYQKVTGSNSPYISMAP